MVRVERVYQLNLIQVLGFSPAATGLAVIVVGQQNQNQNGSILESV